MVEKFLKQIRPEERVPVAYVMDAVVKDSRARNGDKDPFEGRFALRMESSTLAILGDVPSCDRPLLYKLVKRWSQRRRFGLSDVDVSRLEEGWAEESPSGLRSPNKALLSEEYEVSSHIHHGVKWPETLSQSSSSGGNVVTSVVRPSSPVPSTTPTFAQAVPSRDIAADVVSETEPQADLINLLEMSETSSILPNDLYSSGQTGNRSFGLWDSREDGRVMGGHTAMHTELDSRINSHHHQQQRQPIGFPVEQKDQQKHLWQGDQKQHLQPQKSQEMWLTNEPPWKCEQQNMRLPSMQGQQVWQNQNQQQSPWQANLQPQQQQQQPPPWQQQNQHSSMHDPPLSSQHQQLPPHNQKQQQLEQQKWPKTKVGEQMEERTGQKMENPQSGEHKLETGLPKKRQRKSRTRWDQGPVIIASQPPCSTIGKSRAANVAAALSYSESLHTSPRRVCIPPPNVPSPPPPFPPHLRPPSMKITGSTAPPRTGPSPKSTKGTSSLQRELSNGMAPLGPPPSTAVTSSLSRGIPSGVHLGPGLPTSMKTVTSSLPGEVPSGMQMHPGPPLQPTSATSLSKDYVSDGVMRSSHPLPAGLPVSSAVASATGLAAAAGDNVTAVLPRGLPIDCSHPPPQIPLEQHQNVNGGEETRFPLKDKLCRNISKKKPCSHGQNCHFSHSEDEVKAGFRIIRGGADNGGRSGGGSNSLPLPVGNSNQGWGGHATVPPRRHPFLGLNSAGHPRPPVLPLPPPHLRQFNVAAQSSLPPPPSVYVPPGKVATPVGNNDWTNGSEVVRDPVQSQQTRMS